MTGMDMGIQEILPVIVDQQTLIVTTLIPKYELFE
jgi:hypothetical protein